MIIHTSLQIWQVLTKQKQYFGSLVLNNIWHASKLTNCIK